MKSFQFYTRFCQLHGVYRPPILLDISISGGTSLPQGLSWDQMFQFVWDYKGIERLTWEFYVPSQMVNICAAYYLWNAIGSLLYQTYTQYELNVPRNIYEQHEKCLGLFLEIIMLIKLPLPSSSALCKIIADRKSNINCICMTMICNCMLQHYFPYFCSLQTNRNTLYFLEYEWESQILKEDKSTSAVCFEYFRLRLRLSLSDVGPDCHSAVQKCSCLFYWKWPNGNLAKHFKINECKWPNGNSNDLCMAELPLGHSHSNSNANGNWRIQKCTISSICRHGLWDSPNKLINNEVICLSNQCTLDKPISCYRHCNSRVNTGISRW